MAPELRQVSHAGEQENRPGHPYASGEPPPCYVVSYDHGGLVLWGYEHFLEQLRRTLDWLVRHPRLKMGLDNEAWTYDWLAENRPAMLAGLRQALAAYAGRLGIATCTYGQPLAAFLLEESNIRQIAIGLQTTREHLDYPVTVYAFSEHAAFPQLPQVLRGLGMERVLLRTHYQMYGYCPGYDLPIAWWQGPDGSRVACIPTYVHQEHQRPGHQAQPPGPFGLTTEDTWILTRYPSAESPRSLDTFRERFAHIQPLLASRIDDSGLKREELVVELDGRDDYRWATLEEVFAAFPEPTATITPGAEDFGTRMPWGYRGNELFDLARRAEIAVLTAERLLARRAADFLTLLVPSDLTRARVLRTSERELRLAWKDLLVGQHHDVQIVARAGAFGRERLLASLERSRSLLRQLLETTTEADATPTGYVLFNPLPWPRTEATAELPDGTELLGPATALALGFGSIPAPTGYGTPMAGRAFHTRFYQVTFAETGGIVELRTATGDHALLPGRPSGLLSGVVDGVPCNASGSVTVAGDGAGYRVVERGTVGPLPYTATWRFSSVHPRIDCRLTVRFDGERIGAPTTQKRDSRSAFTHEQKLRLRLFPNVDNSAATGIYDVPFGVATTTRPYVEGNYWTALDDGVRGLALFNRGTMGNVREADGAFSVPLAFSTKYIWGAEVICGERHWTFGLLPFQGGWRQATLHRRALEFAFPLVGVPGTLAQPSTDFLRLDNPNVHLTAFYTAAEHGYARFFNGSDAVQPLRLTLPPNWTAQPVDFLHRETGEAGNRPDLEPWKIQTFRLW